MSLAICVVGCGDFAETAVNTAISHGLTKPGPIELFFASRDKNRARAFCEKFGGAGFFGSYEEAAADPRVQAMYICTPHHLHVEHALTAARSSKHILVEKPIAPTVAEAERMIAAARAAGVKLMVAENYRYMPVITKSKELIDRAALGKLRLVQVQSEANFKASGWRVERDKMGGGVFIDGGIHFVDMLVNLLGDPIEVYGGFLPQALEEFEGEDGMALIARFKDGATCLISHAWAMTSNSDNPWCTISGTKGRIQFRFKESHLVLETSDGKTEFDLPGDPTGLAEVFREFAECISEDRTPLMTGEDGLRDLKIVLAAYKSARARRPIKLTG